MNPTTAATGPGTLADGPPFFHLRALREAHDQLLRQGSRPESMGADALAEVHRFIARASATGAVLDSDTDRFAAQRLITYWVNVLCRQGLTPPETTTLDEYTEAVTVTLDDSLRPYVTPDQIAPESTELAGWKRLIRECLERLRKNRLVVVIGAAGSGRQTLITAGVLPWLRKEAIPGSHDWRLLPTVVPGADPLAELVATAAPQADPAVELPLVRKDPAHLGRLLDAGGGPAVVFIDQFEALFATANRNDIQPYLDAVVSLREEGRHYVLLALRSDALPQVAAFERLARAVEDGQVYLMFTNRELRQAIEEPAWRVGLVFDPGVVDWLLNDVQGDPAAAPLLQFSLDQLWDHRTGNRITNETYTKLRGGRVALERTAEALYHQAAPDLRDLLRRVFTALIRPDVTGKQVRVPVPKDELRRLGDPPTVDKVLDRLVASRLVNRVANDQFLLAFGALIEVWPRLIDWLADERAERRRWAVLQSAAERWRDSHFDRTLLWGGLALTEAESYPNLDELQSKFLRWSRRRERRAIRWRRIGIAIGACTLAVLVALGMGVLELLREREKAHSDKEKARGDQEETLRKATELHHNQLGINMSLMSVDAGLFRAGEKSLRDSDDPSGAVVRYGEALTYFNVHNKPEVMASQEATMLADNIRLRLGITRRRLPIVKRLFAAPNLNDAVFSIDTEGRPNQRWVVTLVNPDFDAAASQTVQVWDLRTESGDHKTDDKAFQDLHHDQSINAASFATANGVEFLLTAGGTATEQGYVTLWSRKVEGDAKWQPSVGPVKLRAPGRVTQVRLSPDGRRAVIAVEKGKAKTSSASIWLWQTTAGKPDNSEVLRELGPLPDGAVVQQVAFRPGPGGLVAAAIMNGNRGEVRFWGENAEPFVWQTEPKPGSAIPGKQEGLQHSGQVAIQYLGFNFDGKYLLTCWGADGATPGTAEVWVVDQLRSGAGARLPVAQGQIPLDGPLDYAAFNGTAKHPTDRVILCGANGKAVVCTLYPWGGIYRTGKPLVHGLNVRGADFSPDGRYVVTACRDLKARVWDLQTEALAAPPLDHLGTVTWVGFGSDGRSIASISGGVTRDRKEVIVAQVWEIVDNDTAWYLPTAGEIRYAGGDLGGGHFVTVDLYQALTETRTWTSKLDRLNAPPKVASRPLPGASGVRFAAVNAGGDRVATLSGKSAYVWDAPRGEMKRVWSHEAVINHACFSPDGSLLITATGDDGVRNGEVGIWDVKTGDRQTNPRCAIDWPFLFTAVSSDGKWAIATGGPAQAVPSPDDNTDVWAILWPVASPGDAVELTGHHKEPVTFATFSPDNQYVATAGRDNSTCLWRVESAAGAPQVRLKHHLKKHTADVVQVAFSPHSSHLVTVGQDGKAIVWETESGRDVMALDHGAEITTAQFSPVDGRYLLTAGQDGTVRFWQFQADTGTPDRPKPPALIAAFDHPGELIAAAFCPDGKRLRTLCRPAPRAAARTDFRFPDPPAGSRFGNSAPTEKPGLWVVEWDLDPDRRELGLVRGEAALAAHRKVSDQTRDFVTMTVDELHDEWRRVIATLRDPLPSGVELEARIRYEDREARRAEAVGLWTTAQWHLDQALDLAEKDRKGQPDDAKLREDLYARRANVTSQAPEPMIDWDVVIKDYTRAIESGARRDSPSRAALYANTALAHLSKSLVSALQKKDDWEALIPLAENNYEEFQRLNGNDVRVEARTGDAYEKLAKHSKGYREQAVVHYTRAIELAAKAGAADPEVFSRRSGVYAEWAKDDPTKWDNVIEDCNVVIAAQPRREATADLYNRRAVAFEKKNAPDHARAIDDYVQAARLLESQPVNLAKAIGNLQTAFARAQLHDKGRIPEILKAQGRLLAKQLGGSFSPSASAVKVLVNEADKVEALAGDGEFWKDVGVACERIGDWKAAAGAYEKAVAAVPKDKKVVLLESLAQAYRQAAWTGAEKAYWDKAIDAYDRALALASGDDVLRLWRSKAQAHVQAALTGPDTAHWDMAIEAYTQALTLQPPDRSNLLVGRAAAYEKVGKVDQMAVDYDAALTRQPTWSWLRTNRAMGWAEHDRWDEALKDLKAYVKSSSGDVMGYYRLAVVQLRQDDGEGYRDTCNALLAKFGQTTNGFEANEVAWAIVLGNPSGADPGRAVELADLAVRQNPRGYAGLNTRGVALYRAGDYNGALAQLKEACLTYLGPVGAPPGLAKEDGAVTDQLFLAMTYFKLGQEPEAKQCLAKAVVWLDAVKQGKGTYRPPIWQRAEWELFRRQAEKVIGPAKETKEKP